MKVLGCSECLLSLGNPELTSASAMVGMSSFPHGELWVDCSRSPAWFPGNGSAGVSQLFSVWMSKAVFRHSNALDQAFCDSSLYVFHAG